MPVDVREPYCVNRRTLWKDRGNTHGDCWLTSSIKLSPKGCDKASHRMMHKRQSLAVLVLSQADARSRLRFFVFCVALFAEVGDQHPPPTCKLFSNTI